LSATPSRTSAADAARASLLRAMLELVGERGFSETTISLVCERAGVSRRSFLEQFASLEDCFRAVIDDGARRMARIVLRAFSAESSWIDGVRSALVALLVLFESDPLQARAWHVQTLLAGDWALERRERNLAVLRAIIVRRSHCVPTPELVDVASQGVMAAVLGVVQSRLIAGEDAALLELLGPLMGLVVAPFVDEATREREIRRGHDLARAVRNGASLPEASRSIRAGLPTPRRRTLGRRATACLRFLDSHPGCSNRELAAGIRIAHRSQISRLLGDLVGEQLVLKRSLGVGKRNELWLTSRGQALLEDL
jgi:AcrR family transcriptional regulator